MVALRRRTLLAGAACLASCVGPGPQAPAGPAPGAAGLVHGRTLQGAYLAPALPLPGAPALASGQFVRWLAPAALALRGTELLVADLGTARLWRADLASQAMSAVAGAPVGPGTVLALGPDLAAWVLDPAARQVLRFSREGRLLQTYRVGSPLSAPVALALADGGATVLLGDGLGASWAEQRSPAGLVLTRSPQAVDGRRISGVHALAVGRSSVFVLDRPGAAVHEVGRDGTLLRTLGRGELQQPLALALDRLERVYVLDGAAPAIVRLSATATTRRWSAAELRVGRPAGLAVDGLSLVVSDALGGAVVMHRLEGDAP